MYFSARRSSTYSEKEAANSMLPDYGNHFIKISLYLENTKICLNMSVFFKA